MVTMLANRDPADLEGVAVHLYRASKSMERRVFVDADGELLIIPQSGALQHRTELGRLDVAPGSIAVDPARREVSGRGRGRKPRLCRRESRPAAAPARARSDRLQRPRQSARFRNAGRLVRGQGRADRSHPEIARLAVDDDARSFAARRRRLARQLRAVSLRSVALQRDRQRSASTIPTRRSSPC